MSWADVIGDIRRDNAANAMHAEYAEVVNGWQVYAAKLEAQIKSQALLIDDAKNQIAMANNSAAKFENEATKLRASLSKLESEHDDLQRTNIMNYAEKKAYAAYAREIRNTSDLTPVFEPLLYGGEKGAWIRERVRMAALRIYNAGGNLQECSKAAIREMQQHVRFTPPSQERMEQILGEKVEAVEQSVAMHGNPNNFDHAKLMETCLAVNPA